MLPVGHAYNHPMFIPGEGWAHPQHGHHNAQQVAAPSVSQHPFGRGHNVHGGMGVNHIPDQPGHESGSDDNRRTMSYIADLLNEATRETALLELSKKREQVPELALILWHSFGVMTSLLQEIISVYTLLNPSQLTAAASNRVCNALALLQCVASHNDTRTLFISGMMIAAFVPFLSADACMKLTSRYSCIHFSTRHLSLDPLSI
jgi:CCR4-NOT transcription complex subunit 9